MPPHLFAGMRVRDFEAALIWYEKLLGTPPTSFPHETEAVWAVGEYRSVYVVAHPDAGASVALLFFDDLEGKLAEIADRGLEPDRLETPNEAVRKAVFRDPDGNEFGIGGAS